MTTGPLREDLHDVVMDCRGGSRRVEEIIERLRKNLAAGPLNTVIRVVRGPDGRYRTREDLR